MKRRTFLTTATAVAASTAFPRFAIGKPGKSANSKLNIAFIGSGGWIAQQPYNQGCSEENLVAFCDVDRNLCAENLKNWRTTQPFFDGSVRRARPALQHTHRMGRQGLPRHQPPGA